MCIEYRVVFYRYGLVVVRDYERKKKQINKSIEEHSSSNINSEQILLHIIKYGPDTIQYVVSLDNCLTFG